MEQRTALAVRISPDCGGENYCGSKTTGTKTDPPTSSFWNGKRCKLTAIAGLNPCVWESNRVFRPLWTELPAQTVRVHSLPKSADALLVPIHEFGDDFCGRALQHGPGHVFVAAAGDGEPRTRLVPRMVLVQPTGGHVWLGAAGARTAGLGLFRVERSPSKGQRLVHAAIADVLAGGGGSAAAPLGDTGRAPPPRIPPPERPAPPPATPLPLWP